VITEVLNSYRLTLAYLRRLLDDLPDEALARQPAELVNHPAWVIGHLVHSCEALAGELGFAGWLPPAWREQYGTGSVPTSDRSAYPAKAMLLAALADAESRIVSRLESLGDAQMAVPLPDERYRTTFPTLGHAVTHILTSHAAVHVGQLSAWRRAAGYPPLTKPFI
jgi:uncharacterized damage-inducible protein DinB